MSFEITDSHRRELNVHCYRGRAGRLPAFGLPPTLHASNAAHSGP